MTDPQVLERDLPFLSYASPGDMGYTSMEFAGSSTLYVTDARGGLWRSTDLTTFRQVQAQGRLHGLKPTGDAVLAQVIDTDGMVRIAADGSVEPLTVR